MKSVFIVVIVAIAAYFLFRPTTFTVKNDIFMYKLPKDVYEFMSDLKRTIEKHSIGGKCTLVKQRTRKDGVKEKLYLVEKAIMLFWDYQFPFNMEIRLTLSKPNEELLYNFSFFRGYLLKVHSRMTLEQREGRAMPGTFFTEYLTVTCPWLAQTLVEKNLRDSHKDTLVSLRNGIEGMPVAWDKMKETSGATKEERAKTKTEKKKETATVDKKGKGVKKPSSGQEKVVRVSEPEKAKASKQEKQQTVSKKMNKEASKDVDVKPKRAEKEGERKKGSETSRGEQKETVSKDKKLTGDEKTERKVTGDANAKPNRAEGEKVRKTETRKGDVKAPGEEGSKKKNAGTRKEERVNVEKEGPESKEAKEAKRERKTEEDMKETHQKQPEFKEEKRENVKPGKVKESDTKGRKTQVPKAEKGKIVKPVKSEQKEKEKARTGG